MSSSERDDQITRSGLKTFLAPLTVFRTLSFLQGCDLRQTYNITCSSVPKTCQHQLLRYNVYLQCSSNQGVVCNTCVASRGQELSAGQNIISTDMIQLVRK